MLPSARLPRHIGATKTSSAKGIGWSCKQSTILCSAGFGTDLRETAVQSLFRSPGSLDWRGTRLPKFGEWLMTLAPVRQLGGKIVSA